MTNEFILIEMDDHNCFQTLSQIQVHGITFGGSIKIDTGCAVSVIPFRRLKNISEKTSLKYKKQAWESGLKYIRSYGISDTEKIRRADDILIKKGKILECTAVKFIHKDVDISVGGYQFKHDLAINYDRTGNALLGMDILQDFRFICDKSLITGRSTFIGCLRDQDNQDGYWKTVEKNFGVIRKKL